MGLAIVNTLCAPMGGKIGLESREGHGSMFTLELPMEIMAGSLGCLRNCSEKTKDLPDLFLPLTAAGRALRLILWFSSHPAETEEAEMALGVLVVDDNAVNRRVLSSLLEKLGCTVETVDNGAEAIEKAKREWTFRLILMDCQMPVVDGFEAARRIRNGVSDTVPIWGVSAALGSEIEQERLHSGMNDYLAKPVSLEVPKTRMQLLREANQARQRSQARPNK